MCVDKIVETGLCPCLKGSTTRMYKK